MTETTKRPATIGQAVIFTDSVGQDHAALVTTQFGDVGCNVVLVSSDESRTDTYGRQLERFTSVLHRDNQPAHGMYWRHVDEAKKQDAARSEAHAAAAVTAG